MVKLCECGCGQPTTLIQRSNKAKGKIKGQPNRFLPSHCPSRPGTPPLAAPDEPKPCECGCGQPAPLAKRTHRAKGIYRGQPQRFIEGHENRTTRPATPLCDDANSRYIALTKGKFALVDASDFEWLSQWVWLCHNGYAARSTSLGFMFMHNAIMSPPAGLIVDHSNLDKLDNRRSNLRYATCTQNNANGPSRGGTSSYKGVSWVTRDMQWLAQIQAHGKTYRLGQFDTEIAAALAYDTAARMHFGEFARCNFPLEHK